MRVFPTVFGVRPIERFSDPPPLLGLQRFRFRNKQLRVFGKNSIPFCVRDKYHWGSSVNIFKLCQTRDGRVRLFFLSFVHCLWTTHFVIFLIVHKKLSSIVQKVIIHFPPISYVFSQNDCLVKLFVN